MKSGLTEEQTEALRKASAVVHERLCKCGEAMQLSTVWDNGLTHNYNLYECEPCGMLLRESVWQDAGRRWIDATGEMQEEPR